MTTKRKPNNQLKRMKGLIQSNLAKHAVLFTVSLNAPHFVNRIHPQRRTCVQPLTEALLNKGSVIYDRIRLDWKYYPVVVRQDAFGRFDKQVIHDVGYVIQNATWSDVMRDAFSKAGDYMEEVTPRFRLNFGVVFCLASVSMTQDKIEEILELDANFHVADPDRELKSQREIDEENLETARRLEEMMS